MEFKVGDRVRSVSHPGGVPQDHHDVGTGGIVVEISDEYNSYRVRFDDGKGWYMSSAQIEREEPPCTVEEALTGIAEILEEA